MKFQMNRLSCICAIIIYAVHTTQSLTTVPLGTLSISPLAIGTLNLSVDEKDESKAIEVLENAPPRALIDTAEIYGDGKSEETISRAAKKAGRVLGEQKQQKEQSVLIATKFAPQPLRLDAKSVVTACRESTVRLGVDKIDLYQIHYKDVVQPLAFMGIKNEKDELYWDGLAECYHSGLAANVGVCNYGPTMIRNAHSALAKRGVPLVSNQINFNLMRYRSSMETKAVCDELGIKVLGYHPLGNGALTGKFKNKKAIPYDPNKMVPGQAKARRMRWYMKNSAAVVDAVERIAALRGKTCAQVAINWVMCKGAIPIVGARAADQVIENAGAMGWSLSDEEVKELDAASDLSAEYAKGFELV